MSEETKHLHITFFTEPVFNKRRTGEEGRPIYDEHEFVKIKWVGDKHRELVAPAHANCKMAPDGGSLTYATAYPEHYKAFCENRAAPLDGTPIDQLPGITAAKAKEMQGLHIKTVEALAAVPDRDLRNLGFGGREMREQAKRWLTEAEGEAREAKLAADNAVLSGRLAELEAAMAALKAAPAEPAANDDDPDSWEDDQLRAFLSERDVPVRANASRSKLVAAVREMMAEAA